MRVERAAGDLAQATRRRNIRSAGIVMSCPHVNECPSCRNSIKKKKAGKQGVCLPPSLGEAEEIKWRGERVLSLGACVSEGISTANVEIYGHK